MKSMKSFLKWLAILLLAPAVAAAQESPVYEFDIAAQPMSESLKAIADHTGLQVVFYSDVTDGVAARALEGEYSAEAALTALLDESGLTFEFVNEKTVTVMPLRGKAGEVITAGKTQPASGEALATQAQAPVKESNGQGNRNQVKQTELEGGYKVLDKLSVTGTRLEGGLAGSAVYSIDRAEMDARGLSSIEDVIRYLPQNYSSITKGGSFDGNSPRFSQGALTANLRGLGEGATLVLVNGRRIAASPAEEGTFTDISTIPFSAIERVEVMPDGGSAIYGSDAVAGVINFILKRNYRGSETRLRYEDSNAGGDAFLFEQSFGASWNTGNVTATLNYSREDPALPAKAGIPSEADFREQGGRAFASGWGQPGIINSPEALGAPEGTRFVLLPDGDGTDIDPEDLVYVSWEEWLTQTGNFNLMDFQHPYSTGWATPESEQTSVYVSLDQDIGSSLALNINGIWSERESETERWNNAFRAEIPTSNYYNSFGVPLAVAYSFRNEVANGDLPSVGDINVSKRWSINASLDWSTPWKGWTGAVAYTLGEESIENENYGGIGGLSATDAFFEAVASPDPALALNPFGDGSVQRPNLEEIVTPPLNRGTRYGEQDVLSLVFNGTLFEAAGGSWQMAFGAETRTDELDFGSFDLNPFTFFIPGAPEIVPKSENTAFFVEFGVPLVGEANARSGLQRLNVQLAVRYDDYEIRGPFEGPLEPESRRSWDDTVPKLGVSWYPIDDLQLRASWGETFQAPTLVELFTPVDYVNEPYTPDFFPTFDPYNPESNGGPFVPVFPVTVLGGNPDLQPQTSETTTFGFDWNPGFATGFTLSMTYNRIDFENIISTIFELGYPPLAALENPELYPGLVERDDEGILTFISFQDANLSARETESLDLFAQYSWNSGLGTWRVGTAATKTMKLDLVAGPGTDPISQDGTTDGPSRWRINGFLDWSRARWTANATLLYQDGLKNTDPDANLLSVDSYTTVDIQARYDWMERGWRFAAGVKNLFDEDFPFVDNRYGIDSSRVDFRRRILFLEVIKEFQF